MTELRPQDLLSHTEYEKERNGYRQGIIALKKRRRIPVGPLLTLVFENRETVLFQIQEMLRTERIYDPAKIQEELDVYNALLPASGELSATLFIEITESDRIKERLDSFQEIDRPGTLYIQVGDHSIDANFEAGHSKEDKISAVHFVKFRTTAGFRDHLVHFEVPASLRVTHSYYNMEAKVPEDLRREWINDLDLPKN